MSGMVRSWSQLGAASHWPADAVLDFVQAAREDNLKVSLSQGPCFISVFWTRNNTARFVRFWWNGRVDSVKGTLPNLEPPEWLDEKSPAEWYGFLGVTP